MKWKTKKILTDNNNRKIPQFFDEDKNEFSPQGEVATQYELQKTNKKLDDIADRISKEKPINIVSNYRLMDSDIRVSWFKDNIFYGFENQTMYTSEDAKNWDELETIGGIGGNTSGNIVFIMVSETNRIIVATATGFVFVSNEDGEFEGGGPEISTGRLSSARGFFIHANIIGISTYGEHGVDGDDNTHEAFISTDNGEFFRKIFDKSNTTDLPEPERFHLHDMDYDPFSGAVYIWNGDGKNRNLNVSYDLGHTWKKVFDDESAPNYTQVIATERGVALGADTDPGGFGFVEIDRTTSVAPEIKSSNFVKKHWILDNDESVFYIASRRWVERDKNIYLVPFYSEDNQGRGIGKIAHSTNGYDWNILVVDDQIGSDCGFVSVVYGDGIICGTRKSDEGDLKTFIANVDLEN